MQRIDKVIKEMSERYAFFQMECANNTQGGNEREVHIFQKGEWFEGKCIAGCWHFLNYGKCE